MMSFMSMNMDALPQSSIEFDREEGFSRFLDESFFATASLSDCAWRIDLRCSAVLAQPMRSGMPGTGNPSFCNPFDDVLHVDE
ncbi:hypothetical protein GW17_00050716 [Ensete ventricosum]|nr:hypothetical protein GW17_00050716 [Ensete ventricosum]